MRALLYLFHFARSRSRPLSGSSLQVRSFRVFLIFTRTSSGNVVRLLKRKYGAVLRLLFDRKSKYCSRVALSFGGKCSWKCLLSYCSDLSAYTVIRRFDIA
jgi:hypothetical protein